MIKLPNLSKAVCLVSLFIVTNVNGQNKSQNHNYSGVNKADTRYLPDEGWDFGISSGAPFGLKSTESTLFRGNGMATKMFGRYNFGHVGLGFNTGIIPGTISSSAVSQFITERKFPADALVNSTKPLNAYFLFGPSFNFGNQVKISADVNAGIFYNNAGALSINQQGLTRALYRFDAGSKNVMPGLSGNITIAYPLNNSTRFFINTDYLQTTSSIRLYDPQRGIDIATEQTRSVKLFTAGVGIIKSFGSGRDIATGQSSGKRKEATRDVATGQSSGKRKLVSKDVATGQSSGERILSPRDPASGLSTGKSLAINNENYKSCGPVTIKNTNADGSSEEKTFACTNDALQFKKQTQGATFGEKVNQGLHAAGGALAQGASLSGGAVPGGAVISSARNILGGRVIWSGGTSSGIVTNKISKLAGGAGGGAAAASYAATGMVINGGGGTGISTAIHVRDVSSGQSTGRRQYQPVFFEGDINDCTGCMANAKSNPLYIDKGNAGTNPMHQNKNHTATDTDCDGIGGLKVYLIDEASGAAVATTQTEACGEFWFANVPAGNYVVKISGGFTAKKGYDVYLKNKGSYDVAGEILAADDFFSIEIITAEGTPEEAAAVVKTKTKSNQSNDRTSNTKTTEDDLEETPVLGKQRTKSNNTNERIGNTSTAEGAPEETPVPGKQKTKSNNTNERIGNTNNNNQAKATVNTTRSNIKHLAVSLGDTDDDGAPEIIVGNIVNGASLLGGALPGGAVISAAMRPGGPIGGIIVKGGKNPGGALRTISTNQYGEFEFTGWEEGNYSITANLNYVIADETFIAVGNQTQGTAFAESVNNINGGMPNRISMNVTVPKQTQGATFGEKSNINGINSNGMPNRISMNVTVPKQTQGATFGEKVNAGKMDDNSGSNVTKAQNNNTVKSNRTDNALVIADLDGDGSMESSYLNFNGEIATITISENDPAGKVVEKATSGLKDVIKTQVKMSAGTGPVKWKAPELNASRVWGDPHVDQKDGVLILGTGNNQTVPKAKWQAVTVGVKEIACNDGTCVVISGMPDDFSTASRISLNGLPPGQPVVKAAVWFVDNSGTVYKGETNENGRISLNGLPPGVPVRMLMNISADGSDDFIISFSTDAQGNAISNVLKTKHDTAKNSVGNIR